MKFKTLNVPSQVLILRVLLSFLITIQLTMTKTDTISGTLLGILEGTGLIHKKAHLNSFNEDIPRKNIYQIY